MKIPDFQQQLRLAAIANTMNSFKSSYLQICNSRSHHFCTFPLLHLGPCVILAKSKFSLHIPKAQNLNLKVDLQILTRLWSLVLAYTPTPTLPCQTAHANAAVRARIECAYGVVWCHPRPTAFQTTQPVNTCWDTGVDGRNPTIWDARAL